VSEAIVELAVPESPAVEPAGARVVALVAGVPLASEGLLSGEAPGERRPKLELEEPTDAPNSVLVLGRESVDVVGDVIVLDEPMVLDEPTVLERVVEESGLSPGRHGLGDVVVVGPAGG
jgi:hypothetical protein